MSAASLVRRGLDLLARERAALIRGDLAAVNALARRKSALLQRLAAESPRLRPEASEGLARLRRAAQANDSLFEAVLAGLRDARARIDSARSPQPGTTYARNGDRQPLETPGRTLERRA